MKKSIGLSLVAATLLAGNAMAMDLGAGKLTGDVRALYMSESGNLDESALGLGINPAYSQEVASGLSFEVGVGVAVPVTESKEDVAADAYYMAKSPDTAGDGSEAYSAVTKANVTYSFGDGFIKAGYQDLSTPLASSDDIRLVPNSFMAAVLGYTGIKNLTLVAAQVTQMAGLIDGAAEDAETYNSMSDQALAGVAGSNDAVDDKGVTALAAIYGNEEAGANGQVWYYSMPEPISGIGAITAMYADAGMTFGMVNVAAQYGSFDVADFYSNTFTGLKAEIAATDTVTVIAATNSFSYTDNGVEAALGAGTYAPAWYKWGGYPEWAVADELWAVNADWDGGSASKLAVAFSGVENLSLAAGYVAFSDVGAGVDVIADYAVNDQISAGLVYETVSLEDDYKTANSMDDYTVTKIRASYAF